MRTIETTRATVATLAPDLARGEVQGPDAAADVTWFLNVAVLPGCEAIPLEVEADPDAIRVWMERSLLLQAGCRTPNGRGRGRTIRGRMPMPAIVSGLIHSLAWDEARLDRDPSTLAYRIARRLDDPSRDPMRAAVPMRAPAPVPRPAPGSPPDGPEGWHPPVPAPRFA